VLREALLEVESGRIKQLQLEGDFFMYPEGKLRELESSLAGTIVNRDNSFSKIKAIYEQTGLLSPGVVLEDFTEAIVRAFSL